MAYDFLYTDPQKLIDLNLTELAPRSDEGGTGDVLDISDRAVEAVTELIKQASAEVDSYCGRPEGYFAAAIKTGDPLAYPVATKIIYGDGSLFLKLPPFVKDSIVVDGIVAPDGYSVPKFIEQIEDGDFSLRAVDANGILQAVTSDGVIWQAGVPYAVQGVIGFESVPKAIETAVIQLTIFWYQGARGYLGDVEIKDFAKKFGAPAAILQLADRYKVREKKPASTVFDALYADSGFSTAVPVRWSW